MVKINSFNTVEPLLEQAARDLRRLILSINSTGGAHSDGVARIVLTGGGAGIGILRELRTMDINWELVHLFFGDERNVSVDHSDSNEGQAREALLDHIDIPEANIHGYGLGGVDLEDAAHSYEAVLSDFAPQGFDLHLLGMGGEGHINSIFPHSPIQKESRRLVLPVFDSPKPPRERVSLTYPAIRRSDYVWFLVSGSEKSRAASALVGCEDFTQWPATGAYGRKETVLYATQDVLS
ncbi:6-phosphogluconolactonase [Corynebacterium sp. ES2794-CONJ1]|uniref:6-phosphogluconolactonase n=1 Tax=unclassified Corynebacterium TaxID=2624378 RepID=UPI002168DDED|nr:MULTISPECIES: 6-phosphogluconolactonase [unclassified Corynebacterium]MCS4489289.1 6-phosphogluconolactonase [Corynebacterium sp. ES2775-CONJ]MCS4491102.1 6-phosphogluconolactonase [Corynebacterium sp. ES2715-CONJ3]MCS4531017.1 6-phosphogluconolactonase [Corynebacterium sp. ES2730-CONJ]MCU9518384.1 6-phosphogluconolactonase [Corynebacterium sp. ES2794-CONJ1]